MIFTKRIQCWLTIILVLTLVIQLGAQTTSEQDSDIRLIRALLKEWKAAIESQNKNALIKIFAESQGPPHKFLEQSCDMVIARRALNRIAEQQFGEEAKILSGLVFILPIEDQIEVILTHEGDFDLKINGNIAVLQPAKFIPNLRIHEPIYFSKKDNKWRIDGERLLHIAGVNDNNLNARIEHIDSVTNILHAAVTEVINKKITTATELKAYLINEYQNLLSREGKIAVAAATQSATTQSAATMKGP